MPRRYRAESSRNCREIDVRAYYIKNPRSYRYSGMNAPKRERPSPRTDGTRLSPTDVVAALFVLAAAFGEIAYISVETWNV
jgi:hypothetical protein